MPPAWSLLIVGLGTLVVPLDSAVNIAFPAITAHFGLPIPAIQWIVIAYVLTQTSLMLSFGRIGDMLGYRRVFHAGTGISTVAFLACALAPSYGALIAARVVQGIGAGLILSCGPALATSLYPESMRTQILARYTAIFAAGSALGPAAFGLLVERLGYGAVFSLRAPLALAAFVLAWTLPRPARTAAREAFDGIGGALLALALGFLLLALNLLRHPGPGLALAGLLAATGFILFYRRERRFARPIIDFTLFDTPGFARINAGNALMNLAAFAIMLLAPFALGRIPGLSLPSAGLVLAASPVGMILAAPMAGRLARDRAPRTIVLAGMVLSGAGLFGISMASGSGVRLLALAMAVQGFGMGLFQVAYFDIVTALVPARDRGVAGALAMATRTIGTVTGATVLMLVFQTLRDSDGFEAAFQATFRLAAAIPALQIALELLARRR